MKANARYINRSGVICQKRKEKPNVTKNVHYGGEEINICVEVGVMGAVWLIIS